MVSLAVCGGVPYVEGDPLSDEALLKALETEAGSLYPKSFRMLHRVVLTVSGRQFDFTGYVLIRRPSRLRVVAFRDIGGTIFDVVANSPGETTIAERSPGMKREWLIDGVAGTVRRLYLSSPGPRPRLVGRDKSAVALVYEAEDGGFEEIVFDRESRRLTGLLHADGRRCLRRVSYLDFARFEGWEREVPRRIVVEDLAGRYRLEINVIKFVPMELPDRFFRIER